MRTTERRFPRPETPLATFPQVTTPKAGLTPPGASVDSDGNDGRRQRHSTAWHGAGGVLVGRRHHHVPASSKRLSRRPDCRRPCQERARTCGRSRAAPHGSRTHARGAPRAPGGIAPRCPSRWCRVTGEGSTVGAGRTTVLSALDRHRVDVGAATARGRHCTDGRLGNAPPERDQTGSPRSQSSDEAATQGPDESCHPRVHSRASNGLVGALCARRTLSPACPFERHVRGKHGEHRAAHRTRAGQGSPSSARTRIRDLPTSCFASR